MSKRYTKEYKSEALKLSEEIGSIETSKKLGVSDWTVRRWKKEAGTNSKAENAEAGKRLAAENRELQEKIKELEKENARIKKENEFLEDAASFYTELRSVMQAKLTVGQYEIEAELRFEYIERNIGKYDIKFMCEMLEVSRSGYYKHLIIKGRPDKNAVILSEHVLRLCRTRVHYGDNEYISRRP